MNILFVNYGDYTTASLNHIGIFANLLCEWGHDCVVAVPAGKESFNTLASPRFKAALFSELLDNPGAFANGRPADILHGWTPRECIRKFVIAYQKAAPTPARLLLHLEDNEEHLIATYTKHSFEDLRRLGSDALDKLVHPYLPHPFHVRSFPLLADALTHLTQALAEFAPPTVRTELLPPGLDPIYLAPPSPDPHFRSRLGIGLDEKIISYTGSNTFANEHEIRELYQAVGLLNERGTPTRLVRTGITRPDFLASMPADLQARVLELGFVSKAELPGILAQADVLVQPGRPGPFDDYRLPSKLPEFLASGRPVVLPNSNLAHLLKDGTEALFLEAGDARNIADCCERVFRDSALAASLGEAGARFARAYFDPQQRSRQLLSLYETLLAQPPRSFWTRLGNSGAEDLSALTEVLTGLLATCDRTDPHLVGKLTKLTDDLIGLSSLAEEKLSKLQLEREGFQTRLDDLHRRNHALHELNQGQENAIKGLRDTQRILTELKEQLVARVGELDGAEKAAQLELRKAWSEHAKVAARVQELDTELRQRDEKLAALRRSLSWKLTAPLRSLARLFPR